MKEKYPADPLNFGTQESLEKSLEDLRRDEAFAADKLRNRGGKPIEAKFEKGDLLEEYDERRKALSNHEFKLRRIQDEAFKRREAKREERMAEKEADASPEASHEVLTLTERARVAKGETITPKTKTTETLTERARKGKAEEVSK